MAIATQRSNSARAVIARVRLGHARVVRKGVGEPARDQLVDDARRALVGRDAGIVAKGAARSCEIDCESEYCVDHGAECGQGGAAVAKDGAINGRVWLEL